MQYLSDCAVLFTSVFDCAVLLTSLSDCAVLFASLFDCAVLLTSLCDPAVLYASLPDCAVLLTSIPDSTVLLTSLSDGAILVELVHAAPVPIGDVPAVCEPEAVLPQQLALLLDHVSVTTEEQGQQDVQGCPRVTLQACLVSLLCVLMSQVCMSGEFDGFFSFFSCITTQ